ncbi:MAG: DUF362 domain-containing protein [Bacteroidaceae bacterium]|nr:DUF362 domain-containing protein [Bacteroidaceae bacterium]
MKTFLGICSSLATKLLLSATICAFSVLNINAQSKVYFTKDISQEGLVKIYKALGKKANGKNVAVKISTGEPGGHNFLDYNLIEPLVKEVKGTIVECTTAYGGRRSTAAEHMKVAEEHGFTKIAKVDIMDSEGDTILNINGGKHLQGKNYVGSHFLNYDFTVVLSHFKGHTMAGFGGALKNISIGIGSHNGKMWIHSAGKTLNRFGRAQQNDFLESMAEAAKSIVDHSKGNIIYISVANKLSIDCDCDSHPHDPELADIGILASLDPVALDQACVDMVYNSPDPGKVHLIERIESRNGVHTLEAAEELGIGSRKYTIIDIDK